MSCAYFFALLEEAKVENALVSRGRVKMNQAQSASIHIEDLAKIKDLEACFDLTISKLLHFSFSGLRTSFKAYGRTRAGVSPVCLPMVQLLADPRGNPIFK